MAHNHNCCVRKLNNFLALDVTALSLFQRRNGLADTNWVMTPYEMAALNNYEMSLPDDY